MKKLNLSIMSRKEELEAKLEEWEKRYDELWNAGLPSDEWYKRAQEMHKEAIPISGELHMITDEYELTDIPDYGDKMTVSKFVSCCKYGGFIDSDGFGRYATEDKESDISAVPSEICAGFVRNDFKYVIWYNK